MGARARATPCPRETHEAEPGLLRFAAA
jgi:hypothetical protein